MRSTPLAKATERDLVMKSVDMGSLPLSLGTATDAIVVDVHMAIGFRPNADLARDGLGKLMREVEFTVEVSLHGRALDHHLEVVPGLRRRRHVAHPIHRAAVTL